MSSLVPKSYLVLCAVLWAVCLSLWLAVPGAGSALLDEDGPIEWLSALLMLSSAIVSFWLLVRRGFSPKTHVLVPLLGLLGFLDEISFGTRFLGVQPPRFHSVNIDGAHDFVDLFYQLGTRHLGPPAFIGLVALCVLLFVAAVVRWRRAILRAVRRHEPLPMALLACALLVPALLIDIHVFPDAPVLNLVEELLETCVGLTWLFVALRVGRVRSESEQLEGSPVVGE